MESFDGEDATTTATIKVSPPEGGEVLTYAGGDTSTTKTVKTGKILVFVNPVRDINHLNVGLVIESENSHKTPSPQYLNL